MALVMPRPQLVRPGGEAGAAPAPPQPAASPSQGPDLAWVVGGYVLVAGGALVGWVLWKAFDPKGLIGPAAGISVFAPLYIFAQGIERLIEPFSKFFGASNGTTKTQAEDARNLAFTTMTTPAEIQSAAAAQALVNQIRRNATVFAWGVASFLGMVAAGSFGIFLVAACGFDIPEFWDIALTGLAVGSGTKPLHDLIGNLQKAGNEKADPPQVVTSE